MNVSIGSSDGMHPFPGNLACHAGKAGVHSLTLSAARDLAPLNITVSCVAPEAFPAHRHDFGETGRSADAT